MLSDSFQLVLADPLVVLSVELPAALGSFFFFDPPPLLNNKNVPPAAIAPYAQIGRGPIFLVRKFGIIAYAFRAACFARGVAEHLKCLPA